MYENRRIIYLLLAFVLIFNYAIVFADNNINSLKKKQKALFKRWIKRKRK